MRKRLKLRERLSYANVVATLALFVALGGGAMAASHLGKNSVGTKQLKKNAVTKVKIKKNAVNGPKVKNKSLTGADIKLSKLGTVPSAKNAAAANTADVANTANSLAPAEDWHEVGAPGEPGFQNSWYSPLEPNTERAGFYKDRAGIVHLKGWVTGGTSAVVFQLPPGYRPATGKFIILPVACAGGTCTGGVKEAIVYGPGSTVLPEKYDGAVNVPGEFVYLEGISFRAES